MIGSHVSFTKEEQLLGSVKEAISYDANTFMIYTGAPQNANRLPIDIDKTKLAHDLMKEKGISNILIHAPYIINPANLNNQEFCINFLKQELKRCEELGIGKMVLHPGSHVGLGVDVGIYNVITVLNKVLPTTNVKICLETMAGKGSEIGSNFLELKKIFDGINEKDKILFCLDTCHLNDAGYDISKFDQVLDEFDRIIGINKIGCIHVNDSKNILGSHKDRHANIGYGDLGFNNLISIIYNPRLENVPKILETPYINDLPPYRFEIDMIVKKEFNSSLEKEITAYYK